MQIQLNTDFEMVSYSEKTTTIISIKIENTWFILKMEILEDTCDHTSPKNGLKLTCSAITNDNGNHNNNSFVFYLINYRYYLFCFCFVRKLPTHEAIYIPILFMILVVTFIFIIYQLICHRCRLTQKL
jgi:hypothetical protein